MVHSIDLRLIVVVSDNDFVRQPRVFLYVYRVGQKTGATYYGYCHSLDGATLFSKVDSNKLRIHVKNKMTLIDAKFDADLINISEVTSRKTKWPRFIGLPIDRCCKLLVAKLSAAHITSAKEVMFSPVSACLSAKRISLLKSYWSVLCEILWNDWT